jgi:hypothetical protein
MLPALVGVLALELLQSIKIEKNTVKKAKIGGLIWR